MEFYSTYIFIDVIVVFLLVLFSFFLIQLRVGSRVSHCLLAAFLLALSLSYMDGVLISLGYHFRYTYAHIVYLTMSFDFLVGPLLYLYMLSRMRTDFKLRPVHAVHGLIFLLHFSFLFSRYHGKSLEQKRTLLETQQVFSQTEILALTIVSNLHYLIYLMLVITLLVRYQRALKDFYSNVQKKNLNWLLIISFGLLLGGLLRFLNNLLWLKVPHISFLQYVDLKLFAISSVLVFACVIVYKSLQQPEVLRMPADFFSASIHDQKQVTKHRLPAADTKPDEKYKTTRLEDSVKESYLARLNTYMRTSKPYLNADLTLTELAEALDIPLHHVSQIINSAYGKNFYDFINGYRLQEAAQALQDPVNKKYITQIMYDAGFNSKSVFNTAFKKEFGQTPSAFRKQSASIKAVTG